MKKSKKEKEKLKRRKGKKSRRRKIETVSISKRNSEKLRKKEDNLLI